MYPAFYIQKHKCKGKPKLVKDFPCHLCAVICSYKSNLFRHYKKAHQLEREEVPLSKIKIKRETRPLVPCPNCSKPVTQLCRHACPARPGPSQPRKAPKAVGPLGRPSKALKANSDSESDESTSKTQKRKAPKAVESLDRPGRITRSATLANPASTSTGRITRSAKLLDDDNLSSAGSDSETSVSSYIPSRSPSPVKIKSKSKAKKTRKTTPSNSSTSSDEESDASNASNASRDSILNPKKAKKGKGRAGKKGKALPLPPRTATWRSASDLPPAIVKDILAAYSPYQFSKLMDHQIPKYIGNLKPSNWVLLLANSVGRCVVDAYNLIKLVYDGSRARPLYASPVRVLDAAGFPVLDAADFVLPNSIFN